MLKSASLLFLLIGFMPAFAYAQQVLFSVNTGDFQRENTVVSVDLKQIGLSLFPVYELVEIVKGKKIKTSVQLDKFSDNPRLCWILSGKTPPNTERFFIITPLKKSNDKEVLQIVDKNGGLTIFDNKRPVLQYVYKTVYPPQGIDTAYKRSAFIHPLYSPSGDTLTTIQPKDHYHHYGMWNPWTKLEYDGSGYDLWNLKDRKGTVKFERLLETEQGPVLAGYKVLQGHYIFKNGNEKKIMNEIANVRVWNSNEKRSFLWDFESILHPDTPLPVILKAYRYAGFSIRATEYWTKDNCIMYTSEGKSRSEIDGTKARWVYLTGDCPKGKSGVLIMCHPENYNYPQPLRIWNEKANKGRGDAFINFAPTKDIDWTLESGKKYCLKYRICTYSGEITPEQAEQLWVDYTQPLAIKIQK